MQDITHSANNVSMTGVTSNRSPQDYLQFSQAQLAPNDVRPSDTPTPDVANVSITYLMQHTLYHN